MTNTALRDLLDAASSGNEVLGLLIDDYARFHLVLAVVGSLFAVGLLALSVLSWVGYARCRARTGPRRRVERFGYPMLGSLAAAVAGLLVLVVAANLGNAFDPATGFAGSLGLLGDPPPGSHSQVVQQAYANWLRSGGPAVPADVQQAIDARLAWQRPKAVVCSVLLAGVVVTGVVAWRRLARRSRSGGGSSLGTVLMLGVVLLCVPMSLLLMLMVMGNSQAAIAPTTMTLFYG